MRFVFSTVAIVVMTIGQAVAQQNENAAMEKQKEAIKPLGWMDGVWRGDAWIILPTGQRVEMTQTERIGPMLDGTVKVVEGRGYDADGKTVFNAMGVFAYHPQEQKLMMRSYAQGRVGDFEIDLREDGYAWAIPAGGAEIRYTATLTDGTWHETGERVVPGQPPFKFFEMNLKRITDSKWPQDGVISPK